MLSNVVDRRTNKYVVNCDVAFEPSWHDNSCKDSTHFVKKDDDFSYEEELNTTVAKAVEIASGMNSEVTMYLYDVGNLNHTDD